MPWVIARIQNRFEFVTQRLDGVIFTAVQI